MFVVVNKFRVERSIIEGLVAGVVSVETKTGRAETETEAEGGAAA